MIHTWAPPLSTEVLKGETFSNLRIANFKPESVSLSPICTHAEQCWKEYLNQFCCSHWGSSSSAKSKKDPGSLLPGGNDYYSVLCCPLLWLGRCPKSGADLDIPVPSHPFFLGGVEGQGNGEWHQFSLARDGSLWIFCCCCCLEVLPGIIKLGKQTLVEG